MTTITSSIAGQDKIRVISCDRPAGIDPAEIQNPGWVNAVKSTRMRDGHVVSHLEEQYYDQCSS